MKVVLRESMASFTTSEQNSVKEIVFEYCIPHKSSYFIKKFKYNLDIIVPYLMVDIDFLQKLSDDIFRIHIKDSFNRWKEHHK